VDRAFESDFLGSLPTTTNVEHTDEENLGFFPTNEDRRSLLLAGGLFGDAEVVGRDLLTVLITKDIQKS